MSKLRENALICVSSKVALIFMYLQVIQVMRGVIIENEYNYTYKNKVNKVINDFLSFFVIYVAFVEFQ